MKTYAVALENMIVKRARPVTPEGTVNKPAPAPEPAAAAADKMPLVATAIVTVFAPAAAGSIYMMFPGEGIRCSTNISAVVAASTTAVVFYG